MNKINFLLLSFFLFFFLFTYTTHASEIKNYNYKLYFLEDKVIDNDIECKSVFLFSNGVVEKESDEDVIVLFSKVKVESNINANLYLFFSDLEVSNISLIKKINSLSSNISFANNYNKEINLNSYFDLFSEKTNNSESILYTNKIPYWFICLVFISIKLFISFTFLSLKDSFFKQGFMAIKNNTVSIFRNGIILYISFIILFVIFIVSLVGIPFSIVLFILYYIFELLGEVSLGIFIGNAITKKLKINSNVYFDMFLGVVIFESISLLPYINMVSKVFILPCIATGIAITTLLNVFVNKVFFETPYDNKNVKADREKIKNIIISRK